MTDDANHLPPREIPVDIVGSLGPWVVDGTKWTLAPDAKLTDVDGRVIGTVTELFYGDNNIMIKGTVSDDRMRRMLSEGSMRGLS